MRWLDEWRAPAPDPKRVGWLSEWDYAHRGLHGDDVPENSPSAFADAIARGIGIELDVQRSRDGRAMVFHDWDFDRLTGESGPVIKRNADDIERIRLAGNDDGIPTLRRTLDQIGGKVPVLIELKSAFDIRSIPLSLAVQRALEGYRGKHAIMSFDPGIVRWFAMHAPRIVRGLVVEETKKGLRGKAERQWTLWHAQPDFLAYNIGDLPSPFAAAQRKRGLPVLTWTVRTSAQSKTGTAHADALIAEFEARE
ncbi:MAG: glycerophosphodiester phosphodiesterase family protein [Pontixanthobacter sp.]